MRRRAFNVMCAFRVRNALLVLSLLIALLVAVLWVRSYQPVEDYLVWRGRTTTLIGHSKNGRVWFEHWRGATPIPVGSDRSDLVWSLDGTVNSASGQPIVVGFTPPPAAWANAFGFARLRMSLKPLTDAQAQGSLQAIAIPYWCILVCTLAMPTARLVGMLRRRRLDRRGLCPQCGYDLRATPERCPECGAAPA